MSLAYHLYKLKKNNRGLIMDPEGHRDWFSSIREVFQAIFNHPGVLPMSGKIWGNQQQLNSDRPQKAAFEATMNHPHCQRPQSSHRRPQPPHLNCLTSKAAKTVLQIWLRANAVLRFQSIIKKWISFKKETNCSYITISNIEKDGNNNIGWWLMDNLGKYSTSNEGIW